MENDFNRIAWRQNGILQQLIHSIKGICRDNGYTVFADLPGTLYHYQRFPSHIANTEQRPDLLLVNEDQKKVIIAELTSPMEANLDTQNARKLEKYTNLASTITAKSYQTFLKPFEVSARGFVSKTCVELLKLVGTPRKSITKICSRLSLTAIQRFKAIFNHRHNKTWKVNW